jgi:hypothetical protein
MSLLALAPLAALPWLQGFFTPAATAEGSSHDVVAELAEWQVPDENCVGAAYGGMSLVADLTASPGDERVLASYTQGVFVLDAERNSVLARAPGNECEGSADELVAIAAGDGAIGVPLVAVAASTGGRNENLTWLTLYRVGEGGALAPVFVGEVERHVGRTTRTGTVTLIPGGLVHRDPAGFTSLWTYDGGLGRYVEQLITRPSA